MIKNPTAARHQSTHTKMTVWFENEEYVEFKKLVSESGLTISEYVRRKCLNQKIESTIDAQLVNTLSKLGGLQIKLNTELRSELQNNNADNRVSELIKSHNDLYRDICNCIRELRGK